MGPRECCCENPKIDEIECVLQKLGLVSMETYLKENKQHPKTPEKWLSSGSIKYDMKSIDVTGSSFATDTTTENLNKSTLLKIIAQGIIDHRDNLAKISAVEPEKKKKKRKKK